MLSRPSFIKQHRLSKTAFTRNRSLDFSSLVLFLLNFRKQTGQTELNQFFEHVQSSSSRRLPSQSALTQARSQLCSLTFKTLNNHLVNHVYAESKRLKHWKGFRLAAIDGSMMRLPKSKNIVDNFGVHKGQNSTEGCPMALCSVFYDVLNRVVIDSTIESIHTSERTCAIEHLHYSTNKDLVLYDRGYGGFPIYAYHQQCNRKFCARVKVNQLKIAQAFVKSGAKQQVVTLKPSKYSANQCQQNELDAAPITLRLIRVDLDSEVEVLITNLMDERHYPTSCFKHLYFLRWGIEENYKRLKQWLEITNFSGKTALSIRQDFFAKILAANLTEIHSWVAQKKVNRKDKKRKLKYRVNFAQTVSKMKHSLVRFIFLAHGPTRKLDKELRRLINKIALSVTAIRKGRKFNRTLRSKEKLELPIEYKSCL
ncbi:IS4 family transposase [Thiomicrorhabdus hydrogeniphila]